MTAVASAARTQPSAPNLPSHRDPYYAGKWQKPKVDRYVETISPGTGEPLGKVIDGSAADAEAAIAAAKAAFAEWRRVPPLERAKMLRAIADVLRKNGEELAMIDAADCGNPYAEMVRDAQMGAAQLDFYAGLVTEMKGASIPMGPDAVNFSVREPFGVVGRIIPFNHPFMFVAGKSAAPLAAGNTIVVKPPEQAPLSSLRLAELIDGMNFTWCGQSCGSTSRAFVHEKIYDAVLERVKNSVKRYKPGIPTDPATTMGSIVSKVQYDRVLGYIEAGKQDGARLLSGGKRPSEPHLAKGFYVEPTVFADVTMDMRIGKEEIFGPILSILKWSDEDKMLAQVNQVEYGLTCSIWTNDLVTAHRAAAAVEAGFVWINDVSKHFLGAPFGGYKQSGVGREEGIEELISFTREKNIHLNLRRRTGGH